MLFYKALWHRLGSYLFLKVVFYGFMMAWTHQRLESLWLCILLVVFHSIPHTLASNPKIAVLSAQYTSQRQCNTTNSYKNLFNDPNSVMNILSVNPGLNTLVKVSESIYRGELAPIHAPGLSIYQTIDFHIEQSPNAITITVPGDAVKQTYKGIPFLVKVRLRFTYNQLGMTDMH